MKYFCTTLLFISISIISFAQQCRFEKTNGMESATYFEAVDWYKQLDKISIKERKKEPLFYIQDVEIKRTITGNDFRIFEELENLIDRNEMKNMIIPTVSVSGRDRGNSRRATPPSMVWCARYSRPELAGRSAGG